MEPSESKSEEIALERIRTNCLGDAIIRILNLEEDEFLYQRVRGENSFELSFKSYHLTQKIIDEKEINTIIKTHYEQRKYNVLENSQYIIFTKNGNNRVKSKITKQTHQGKNLKDTYDYYDLAVWEENPP